MKKLIAATLGVAALTLAPTATASPAICDGHADYSNVPNGMGNGNRYITACGGDSGPDWSNNAQVPHIGWGDNG